MTADSKNSINRSLILVLLGLVVFIAGARWLTILIPAAIVVWYGTHLSLGSGRN